MGSGTQAMENNKSGESTWVLFPKTYKWVRTVYKHEERSNNRGLQRCQLATQSQ